MDKFQTSIFKSNDSLQVFTTYVIKAIYFSQIVSVYMSYIGELSTAQHIPYPSPVFLWTLEVLRSGQTFSRGNEMSDKALANAATWNTILEVIVRKNRGARDDKIKIINGKIASRNVVNFLMKDMWVTHILLSSLNVCTYILVHPNPT